MKQSLAVLLCAFVVHGICAPANALAADSPATTTPAANTATTATTAPVISPIQAPVESMDDVVARVGDRTVTLRELSGPLVEAYGLNVLLNLVQLELAQQQAETAGVTVTEADVVAERERTIKTMFQDADPSDYDQFYQQFLQQQGISDAEFNIVMRTNATLRNVAEPMLEGKITDEALRDAFNALYGEKVKVRHIQLANLQEVQQAKARLEKESFEQVAREVSRDPRTKAAGGALPEFSRAMQGIPEPLKNAAFALKEGDVSDPIMANDTYHLIKLEKRIPPTAVKFEDVKQSVYEEIHEQAMRATIREFRNQIGRTALEQMKIEVPALQRQFDQRREQASQQGSLRNEEDIRKQLDEELKRSTGSDTQPAPATPAPTDEFKLPETP